MRPNPDRVLMVIAGALGGIIPEVRTPFGAQTAGLSAMLAGVLAQEWDRAAARLVDENAAVRDILAQARGVISDDALRARIQPVVERGESRDFRVSALQAENDALRALLVEVHALIDGATDEAGSKLDALIWDELRESTRRRRLVTR